MIFLIDLFRNSLFSFNLILHCGSRIGFALIHLCKLVLVSLDTFGAISAPGASWTFFVTFRYNEPSFLGDAWFVSQLTPLEALSRSMTTTISP